MLNLCSSMKGARQSDLCCTLTLITRVNRMRTRCILDNPVRYGLLMLMDNGKIEGGVLVFASWMLLEDAGRVE